MPSESVGPEGEEVGGSQLLIPSTLVPFEAEKTGRTTVEEMNIPITIDEIVVGDDPSAWRRAGFTVDADGICRAGHVRVHLVGRDNGKRILSWSLRGLPRPEESGETTTDIDGLPTTTSESELCEPAVHDNRVMLIDHIVLMTPNQQRTIATFAALGVPAKRTRETDTYGAPFLQTFFRAGEVIIELIGPETPSGDGPAAFFGLAYTVDDLDRLAETLGDGVGEIKDAVQPGRRITTLRHRDFDVSVATAFMSAEHDGHDPVDALDAAAG